MDTGVEKEIDMRGAIVIDQLNNYVASNPLSVITAIGLFIGGLVMLVYFGSIQYFPPDLNLSSVSLLLAAAAITGLLLTLLLALYFVLPGFFYRHMLHEQLRSLQPEMLNDRAIFWLLDVPMIVATYLVIIVALFQPNDAFQRLDWALLLIVFILIGFGYLIGSKSVKETFQLLKDAFNEFKLPKFESVKAFAVAAFTIVISGVVASIPLLFILVLAAKYEQNTHDKNLVWLAFATMCIFALFANHLVAGAKKWWVLFVVAPIVLLAMLGMSQQLYLIPQMVVRALALGNIPNVTLLLDEQGCQVAGQYTYPAQYAQNTFSINVSKNGGNGNTTDLKNKEAQQKATICILPSVTLLWRIGNEYFIEASQATLQLPSADKDKEAVGRQSKKKLPQQHGKQISFDGDKKIDTDKSTVQAQSQSQPILKPRFTISSVHVLSWSVTEQKKSEAR